MVELNNGTNVHLSPGIYTVFLFIPFAHLSTFWKVPEGGEAVTDQTQVVLFLLFFFGITVQSYGISSSPVSTGMHPQRKRYT